ncbi:MAG: fused MFS/spermidine synthase [Alphaproteobacteria bacterium]|nr:fused MFS/spermidine synthase [Alphaproteobacteria bacterium]
MTTKMKWTLLTVICMLGFTSMSFELIILRQLINFVGSNTIITSIVISFILLFLSLGYYLGSVVSFAKIPIRIRIVQLLDTLALWYLLACTYETVGGSFYVMYNIGMRSSVYMVFMFSAIFLALPSVALGFITAAIGRIIHHFNADYTGRFMAVDTIGSVGGSLLTTLLLMPIIGVTYTIVVLSIITAFASLLIGCEKIWINCVKFACFVSFGFILSSRYVLPVSNTLIKDDAISRMEVVSVTDDKGIKTNTMYINGQIASVYSTGEDYTSDYVRFINDNLIDTMPKGKIHKILVLGAGGFTVGLHDTQNQYVFVDIEKNLPAVTEERFLEQPLPENKKFEFADAYLYLLNSEEKYDLIVVDVYSAIQSIPENFVTADFFKLVKEHLAENGIMAANIITSASFENEFSRRIDNTLRYVFKNYISRQIIKTFNPYNESLSNVMYLYYNRPEVENTVYTIDKNSALYGQQIKWVD